MNLIILAYPPEFERISFVKMPRFIGSDPVPPAMLALDEEEIDRGQRGARRPLIRRLHLFCRPKNLPVISTLSMWLQAELTDQLLRPFVHYWRLSVVDDPSRGYP